MSAQMYLFDLFLCACNACMCELCMPGSQVCVNVCVCVSLDLISKKSEKNVRSKYIQMKMLIHNASYIRLPLRHAKIIE